MPSLTSLEVDAIKAIIGETPEWSDPLSQQLQVAEVTKRENKGGGFFTDLLVLEDAPKAVGPNYLGHNVHAAIKGLNYGIGLILFLRDGRMHQLEGYAVADEDTLPVSWEHVAYRITGEPSAWIEDVR